MWLKGFCKLKRYLASLRENACFHNDSHKSELSFSYLMHKAIMILFTKIPTQLIFLQQRMLMLLLPSGAYSNVFEFIFELWFGKICLEVRKSMAAREGVSAGD